MGNWSGLNVRIETSAGRYGEPSVSDRVSAPDITKGSFVLYLPSVRVEGEGKVESRRGGVKDGTVKRGASFVLTTSEEGNPTTSHRTESNYLMKGGPDS